MRRAAAASMTAIFTPGYAAAEQMTARPSRGRGPTSTALSATLYPRHHRRRAARRLRTAAAGRNDAYEPLGKLPPLASRRGRWSADQVTRGRAGRARHRQAAVDQPAGGRSWPRPARPDTQATMALAKPADPAAAVLLRPPATKATAVTAPAKRRGGTVDRPCRGAPACGGRRLLLCYQARVTPDPAVVGAARKQQEAVEAEAAKRKAKPTRSSPGCARRAAAAPEGRAVRPRSASRSRRRPGARSEAEMAARKRVEDEARQKSRSRDSGPAGERARRPGRKPRRRRRGRGGSQASAAFIRRQRDRRRPPLRPMPRQASQRQAERTARWKGTSPLHAVQARRRLYHPRADPQRVRRLRQFRVRPGPGPGTSGQTSR